MALDFNNYNMERLFLLEILVDNLQLNYSKIDLRRSFLNTIQRTSVRFYFQDYPPVEVCEDDFCPMTSIDGNQVIPFKSGKACLFSLQHVPTEMEVFEVGAEVFGQPDDSHKVMLARACIDLGELFACVVNEVRTSCQAGPITRAAKNCYPLVGDNGVDVGVITIFVRVSCFGTKIVGGKVNPCTDLGGNGEKGGVSNTYFATGMPMVPSGDLSYPAGLGYTQSQISQTRIQTGNMAGMPVENQGVGAMFQGNVMNYSMSATRLGGMGTYSMTGMGVQGMGAQGMGAQGMGAQGMGAQGMGPPYMGGMPAMGTAPNNLPGMVGFPNMGSMGAAMPGTLASVNQIPLTQQQAPEVTSDLEAEDILKQKAEKPPEDPDKNKDVLKLEIGNKNKIGKKPKIEIVLKTPKLKFDEIKTEDRDSQYLESDLVQAKAPAKKGKGKKGGKKKGKKGGKGKKGKKKK